MAPASIHAGCGPGRAPRANQPSPAWLCDGDPNDSGRALRGTPPPTVAVRTAGDVRVSTLVSPLGPWGDSGRSFQPRGLWTAPQRGYLHPQACGDQAAPRLAPASPPCTLLLGSTCASCPRASCPLHGRRVWPAPGPRPQQSQLGGALDRPVAARKVVEASAAGARLPSMQRRPELPGSPCGSRAARSVGRQWLLPLSGSPWRSLWTRLQGPPPGVLRKGVRCGQWVLSAGTRPAGQAAGSPGA